MAAYSTSPGMLIAARALLGIAGATLMPSTMALIRNMFRDPKQMAAAIGIWFACFMGGMTLGPLVGGALLSTFWWGSAFLLGVPFMALLLVAAPVLLPEYRDTAAGRLDLASVALSLAAILPVIYGLKEIARNGWRAAAVVAVVAGVLVGVVFVRRQRRLTSPLLDLRLFANRSFRSALATMLATGIVMAGVSLMSILYLQAVRGLSPMDAGLWLVPQNIAMVGGFMIAPALARRIRPAYLMAAGLLVAGAGLLVQTRTDAAGGVAAVVVGLTLAGLGISPAMALTANLVLGSAPPEKAGSAASISETSGEFGVALGVAALGSLATIVYRAHLDHPCGYPRRRRPRRPPGHHRRHQRGPAPSRGARRRPARRRPYRLHRRADHRRRRRRRRLYRPRRPRRGRLPARTRDRDNARGPRRRGRGAGRGDRRRLTTPRGSGVPQPRTARVSEQMLADAADLHHPPHRWSPGPAQPGRMFLLWWKALSGSYLALTSASRR